MRPRGIDKQITLEVSHENKKLRLAFLIGFILLAAAAFAFGIYSLSSKKPGWTEIDPSGIPDEITAEYSFFYKLGETDKSATKEYRSLTAAYSSALATAYAAFDSASEHEAGGNLATLSKHPNERVTVMPELYRALEVINSGDGRKNELFMGPVYYVSWQLMTCRDDTAAAFYDPDVNSQFGDFCSKVAEYSAQPESIRIELFEGNTVMLCVSEEYLKFAEDNGVAELLGLGWMRNAFMIDCVADELISAGWTNGIISAYDGFSRSLGVDGELNCGVFSNDDGVVSSAAVLRYNGKNSRASVSLSPFPITAMDKKRFYVYSDGTVRDSYVFSEILFGFSGYGRYGYGYLLAYKDGASCAGLSLMLNRSFIPYGGEMDSPLLWHALVNRSDFSDGAEFIYVSDNVYYTEVDADIVCPDQGSGIKKNLVLIK